MTGRVEVVCTDDQQHVRSLIGVFTRPQGGEWTCATQHEAKGLGPDDYAAASKGVYVHSDAWSFRCGNCRKYLRVSFEDCKNALTSMSDVAVTTLDVSMLIRVLSTRKGRRRKAR